MQLGQPARQGHEAMASCVARVQVRANSKPRSAKPEPPGKPSCTNTVAACVSRCWALATPPISHLSQDRKSTRLNSSHVAISYAVFCLKKKKQEAKQERHARQTPNRAN